MLHALNLRKALRTVMFLVACIFMTGCYTLKSVSVNNIPPYRNILVVHADDFLWTVDSYSVTEGLLTGHIGSGELKIKKGTSAHLYVAPSSAVTVEGETITLPIANIAKADYYDLRPGESIGSVVIWASTIYLLAILIASL